MLLARYKRHDMPAGAPAQEPPGPPSPLAALRAVRLMALLGDDHQSIVEKLDDIIFGLGGE